MDETIQTMRIEIDGRWTAADMGQFFAHIEEIYNLRLVLQVAFEDWRDWEELYLEMRHFLPLRRRLRARAFFPAMLRDLYQGIPSVPLEPKDLARISRLLYPAEALEVRRIEYGSPGYKDLAGLGEIVGHVKDFILRIIEHRSTRRQRDLESEERELTNQRLRIENAREFVKLAKECGYSEAEIRKLITWTDDRQETFIYLVDNGKVRSIKLLSDEGPSEN